MNPDFYIDLYHNWLDHLERLLATTSPAEIVAALTLPMLALLIGIRVNRHIDSKPQRTISARLIDFFAPLISPVLAILLTLIVTMVLSHMEREVVLMPFVLKLCVAWLAIHVVLTLSAGKTAGLFILFFILPITMLHLFGVWDYTVETLNSVKFTIGGIKFNLYVICKALVNVLAMIWAVNFVLGTTDARLRRVRTMRASNRTLIIKFMQIGLYVLVFLFALNLVGVSLTTLSIFSGAIGVGIGFGLQKIASNFISGIILLFEKSIEVGDIVELEQGVTGTVMHTSGRYTLIGTFDGKDVLIPNEEFITQRVTSLTHSNRTGRIEIDVGISYGDNVERALELLLEAAEAHPRCVSDPAPKSFVTGLGESSVDLRVMFWVEDVLEGRLEPKSQVIMNFLALFAQNDIHIPFPHQVQIADPAFEERFARIEAKLNGLGKKTPEPAEKEKPPAQAAAKKPASPKASAGKSKGAVE